MLLPKPFPWVIAANSLPGLFTVSLSPENWRLRELQMFAEYVHDFVPKHLEKMFGSE